MYIVDVAIMENDEEVSKKLKSSKLSVLPLGKHPKEISSS